MLRKAGLFFTALAFLCLGSGAAFAERLSINGSTTVLPAAQKLAEAFMKVRPDVTVSVAGGGSGNGIKAIVDGTTHVGNSSRFIRNSEVRMAVEKDTYPVPFRIGLDCIVPVVHPDNPVKDLSLDQLRDMYTGKIRNWKEVGGRDMRVVVISRDSSSGTFESWGDLVMNKQRVVPSALTVPSNGGLVQAVTTTPGAIGYIALGYVNKDVKMVSVDGVMGSEENTISGRYPISRPLFMFTRGWPEGVTLDFINFVFSKKGQEEVKASGSIPVY
ncbi:phosphate ABC transporter substrate-binding protein [Desulfobotulus mexicanus]|uniref:Phosphate-binding protein n=1 Tax=Desulfobotulus mexicanus TaxID=2586642 RepID=A0A5Q4VER9_9BACT|nr:phosphate ABC transporter substrate-binding protein [Desulfobotulus mexicanus]TYT76164.1 phosphate ABC transporter substrate-binding protein [Desulfobotulus mexicanus]